MRRMKKPYSGRLLRCILSFLLLFAGGATFANTFQLRMESGAAWFSRNDVRIPGDSGDTFDMRELLGDDAEAYIRVIGVWEISDKHAVRVTLAPFEAEGTGTLPGDVRFEDGIYKGNTRTKGSYQFNTYRLGYRWTFHEEGAWTLGLGGIVLVRDAEIALEQGNLSDSNTDLGVVPLLGFYAEYQVSSRWSLEVDAEGLASPYGRAFDVALLARWRANKTWSVLGGYRTIEGGADNDDVYTFAWIHFASLAVEAQF